jgi:hypothetical protein
VTQKVQSGGPLPVDPERLKRQFPDLTDADLAAYTEVTHRILAESSPDKRARLTRETLARGREAREKQAGGAVLARAEALDLAYLLAVAKMQSSTVRR